MIPPWVARSQGAVAYTIRAQQGASKVVAFTILREWWVQKVLLEAQVLLSEIWIKEEKDKQYQFKKKKKIRAMGSLKR